MSRLIMPGERPEIDDSSTKDHEEACPTRDWSELCNDILVLISERLASFKDQIRLRAVCKDWRLVTHGLRRDYKLPWLLSLTDGTVAWKPRHHILCNPWSQEEYLVENKDVHNCNSTLEREIIAVKAGWVLTRDGLGCGRVSLYCPFTQETVVLPHLPDSYSSFDLTVTYCPSTKARSFVVYSAVMVGISILWLAIWRSGDEAWECHSFLQPKACRGYGVLRVACVEGDAYCVLESGLVERLEFSGKNRLCIVVEKAEELGCGYHLDPVVCEGELFLVSCDVGYGRVRICRVDSSEKRLVEETSLGKKALFLDLGGLSTVMVSVGEEKDLAGRIYYRTPESFRFREFGATESQGISRLALPRPTDYFRSRCERSFGLAMMIEPPNLRSTN